MTDPSPRSTIVGVATGTPDGGVAVVRISGPDAVEIAGRCVRGALPEPRKLGRRGVGAPDGRGRAGSFDDALVAWMPGPGSFTGEDVVELHVHAGRRNVEQILGWLVEAGARASEAGEFTRRAFESGKLSLDQAEGIAALIGAKTQRALEHARRLVAGELRREVESVRTALMQLRLDVEGAIGFPDDVELDEALRWSREASEISVRIDGWLRRFEAGRKARSVARVVLAGPPNAGKSALFNELLGRRRALVAEVAGTTRDFLEAELVVEGYVATLVDTAGLRDATDAIEAAGVELTRDQVSGADLVVWVEASDAPAVAESDRARCVGDDAAVLLVESKRDLGVARDRWFGVSVQDQDAVAALRGEIRARVWQDAEEGWIGLARHRDRASEARDALVEAASELGRGLERLEIAALPLMIASARLGEICGEHTLGAVGEDVLSEIFSRFCIGK